MTVWAVLNGEVHVTATDCPWAGTICSVEGVPPVGTAIHVVGVEGLSVQPASAPPLKLLESCSVAPDAEYDQDGGPYEEPVPMPVKSAG